ncbi:572_t:CDS:2, partial [Gigaspora rosea]
NNQSYTSIFDDNIGQIDPSTWSSQELKDWLSEHNVINKDILEKKHFLTCLVNAHKDKLSKSTKESMKGFVNYSHKNKISKSAKEFIKDYSYKDKVSKTMKKFMEDFVNIESFKNDQCYHERKICRECVGKYIKHELEDNGNVRIACPEDGCTEILDQKDVKKFANEESFRRYERFTLKFALSQIPTFQWCLNPNCESGQDHYQGDKLPIMTCNSCGHKSCVVHGHPVDDDVCKECIQLLEDEERRIQEEESESYVSRLKQCPNCVSRIEKNEGCDHMTCRCGHQFCWV